ncbi:hypothetical protein U9M48_027508 [Paspalum notatum var. saurae]|uniref:Uncharacterized protein n=1 Tax=Paspalum notatum var. saurae TaxID=547442 RepID=A0AAQ3TUW5_PASNO
MPRIPMIRFPKRNLKAPSPSAPAASQPADQHATFTSRLGKHRIPSNLLVQAVPLTSGTGGRAKVEAPSSGEIKNYRFRSDVPSPPSHTAVGGPASLLPKRKPLTEEEIEAIMLGGSI